MQKLSACAIVTLVALRLVVGWHFYKEGVKKKHDPNFSSAGFLSMAKGPLAEMYHSFVPDLHDWNLLVATPLEQKPLTAEQEQEIAEWRVEREKMLADSKKAIDQWNRDSREGKEGTPEESPKPPTPDQYQLQPHASYKDWAEKIDEDWRSAHGELFRRLNLTKEQEAASADALENRLHQLRDYFEGVPEEFDGQDLAIGEYRHELWRLERLEAEPFASDVPYQGERIQQKAVDARGKLGPWKADIVAMEQGLLADWKAIVATADTADKDTEKNTEKIDDLLEPEGTATLRKIDTVVTYLTLGVGACLILGLFTRLASVAGAAFLFSVIISQPPWVEGAMTDYFYYQVVELTAMLALAAVGAGRWAGLDFFLGSACRKCCGKCCGNKGTK